MRWRQWRHKMSHRENRSTERNGKHTDCRYDRDFWNDDFDGPADNRPDPERLRRRARHVRAAHHEIARLWTQTQSMRTAETERTVFAYYDSDALLWPDLSGNFIVRTDAKIFSRIGPINCERPL